jgi:hypothetical protein
VQSGVVQPALTRVPLLPLVQAELAELAPILESKAKATAVLLTKVGVN